MKRFLSFVFALFASSASAQINSPGIILFDEASQLGRARSIAFVGSTVSCGISGGQATCTFTAPTITHNSTATSGCTGGAVFRSTSSLVDCGAGLVYASGILTTSGGAGGFVAPVNTPAYAFNSGYGSYGLYLNTVTGGIELRTAANAYAGVTTANGFGVSTDGVTFYSTTVNAGTANTRLVRHSTGVLRIGTSASNIATLLGGGATVASAAALPVPTGSIFEVSGTTNITSISTTNLIHGVEITLIFQAVLTVTDGNNLYLNGDLVTAAGTVLKLAFNGTNFYEVSRSIN